MDTNKAVLYVVYRRCHDSKPNTSEGYHMYMHHSFRGVYVACTTADCLSTNHWT